MKRCALIAATTIAWLAVGVPARAQLVPFPVPPLPLPSSDFGPNRDRPNPTWTSSPPTGATIESADLRAATHDSTDGARAALRRSRTHESWYGWQTLAIDASAVGILILGAAIVTTRPPMLEPAAEEHPTGFEAVSLAVYAAGPVAVHVAHRNFWQAVCSLGLRVGLPLAGFAFNPIAPTDLSSASRSSDDTSTRTTLRGRASSFSRHTHRGASDRRAPTAARSRLATRSRPRPSDATLTRVAAPDVHHERSICAAVSEDVGSPGCTTCAICGPARAPAENLRATPAAPDPQAAAPSA